MSTLGGVYGGARGGGRSGIAARKPAGDGQWRLAGYGARELAGGGAPELGGDGRSGLTESRDCIQGLTRDREDVRRENLTLRELAGDDQSRWCSGLAGDSLSETAFGVNSRSCHWHR